MKNTFSKQDFACFLVAFLLFKKILNSFSPSKKEAFYPVDECHLLLIRDNEGNISCVTKN